MSRWLRHAFAACLVCFTALPAFAQDRCGTPEPSPEFIQQVEQALEGMSPAPSLNGGIIQVAFHVIHNGVEGNIPQSQIDDQIQVLNAAYGGLGVTFQLALVNRINNPSWFAATNGSAAEAAMHAALAVDPLHYMNFYTLKPGGGLLGWAYFPASFPENSVNHSVNVHYQSVPGGTLVPYHLGDTGTHEVGHYLGLYHTFQGGCGASGDLVADTPREASPAFGCPIGRDTCVDPGLDPIENFMDYTDDACMDEFTAGQVSRMSTQVATFRPNLLTAKPTAAVQRSWGQVKVTYR